MKQPLTIITGASRGLGLALADQCAQQGHRLLLLSRRAPASAIAGPGPVEHWSVDLAEPAAAADRLQAWLQALAADRVESATLINNAGVIPGIGPLSEQQSAGLASSIRVGLEAPLLLTAAFLRGSAAWRVARKVLLVPSGLGRRGMAGSAAYCAAKAGMDNLARAVALEEAMRPDGAKIVSLAPGVIDTDMQLQLRNADAASFPEQWRFLELHAAGQLDAPAEAARKVLRYLSRPDFGSHPVADVRDT